MTYVEKMFGEDMKMNDLTPNAKPIIPEDYYEEIVLKPNTINEVYNRYYATLKATTSPEKENNYEDDYEVIVWQPVHQ